MNKVSQLRPLSIFALIALLCTSELKAQTRHYIDQIRRATPNEALKRLAEDYAVSQAERQAKALSVAAQKGWPVKFISGRIVNELVDIDELGNPVYKGVDNLPSARTVGVDKVWPGGTTGYNLSGKGLFASQWDAGSARLTHVELRGRTFSIDGSTADDHSTHTAGTIMGKGVNPTAKGMAYETQLRTYNTSSPINQMANEANLGSIAGNHSWSYKRGFQPGFGGWVWLGPATAYVDPGFGYYSNIAAQWDAAALNMPYFLNCKSSGNDRGSGPRPGETYTIQANGTRVTQPAVGSATYRAPNGPYGCQANHTVSKNLMSVAAVTSNNNGYSGPNSVAMSSFSSWGPTDDGRIKPDISAVGVGVLSSVAGGDNTYDTYDGTSMSTPSMTGNCILVQEQYLNTHNNRLMRAETLKGLLLHTADELGANPGPDYAFGWGLANIKKACDVIYQDSVSHYIKEMVMNQGQTVTIPVTVGTAGELRATISWFDQPGQVDATMPLDDRTPKLVNDLDLRIKNLSTNTVTQPWILDPANPATAATRGDNFRDNVEQVVLANATPGQYEVTITHKGNLVTGRQSFGLIISGITGPFAGRVCLPILHQGSSTGTITDGSGTASYQDNTDCAWQIDVSDTTSAVAINFTAMGLAAGDTVYLYSGTATNRTLRGKFSGNTIPTGLFYGGKGRAYIRFVSDAAGTGAGFSLNWNIVTLPQVAVAAGATEVCSGSAVRFTASTTVAADTAGVTWQWSIPGAIPPNPTGRTPVVLLPNVGRYTATVNATNLIGSVTKSEVNLVRANNGNIYDTAYHEERFDANTSWPRNTIDTNGTWRVTTTPASNTNWSRTTLAAFSGNGAAYIRNNSVLVGTVRELISPNFDMRRLTTGQRLRFRIASARSVANANDILRLFYSINCGATWTALAYTRSGTSNPAIYTVTGNRTFPFVPVPSEWRLESVALPANLFTASRCQFKWEYTNNANTNLYMDDVMIGDSALVSLDSKLEEVSYLATAYPNPGSVSQTQLRLNLDNGTEAQIIVSDLLGRRLAISSVIAKSDDETIALSDLMQHNSGQSGLYIVTVQVGRKIQRLKLLLD